jgi:beta-lactamase class A
MIKQRIAVLIIYSLLLLFIGRNLTFLPAFGGGEKKFDLSEKRESVQKILAEREGDFSIYYQDIHSGQSFGIDENKVLTAASLNKIYIIGYLYYLAGKEKIDLEETLTIQKEDIQDYGTGSLRYDGEGKSYTLKALSELALRQSDNTAAFVLSARIGRENIQKFVNDLGLAATDIEKNRTSAQNAGVFFKLLYDKKITTPALTREMLGYMTDTDFEDRLALFIKDKAHIYHKSADAVAMIHDAGIVDDGKKPFIIVVLSSGIKDEQDAKITIGKIAHDLL